MALWPDPASPVPIGNVNQSSDNLLNAQPDILTLFNLVNVILSNAPLNAKLWTDKNDSTLSKLDSPAFFQYTLEAAAQITAGTFLKMNKSAYFVAEVVTTGGIDWRSCNKQFISNGNVPITFTNNPYGPSNMILRLGSSGGSTSLPSGIKWPGGQAPVFTGESIISFYYSGSTYYGSVGLNFS